MDRTTRAAARAAGTARYASQPPDALKDENRRSPVVRDPILEDVLRSVPERPFELDKEEFLHSFRTARRGAEGMRQHLRSGSVPFCRSEHPRRNFAVLRVGKILALQKPSGGVRHRGWRRGPTFGREDHGQAIHDQVRDINQASPVRFGNQGVRASRTHRDPPEPQCCRSMESEFSQFAFRQDAVP